MPSTPVTYGDINFKGLDTTQYRYIEFNGYNSLTDLGLVINGLAPLSPVTPKIITKDIPLSDGVIDVSRVDGELHYNPREITYDFLFVNEKSKHYGQTITTEEYINNAINNIYQWLLGAAGVDLYDSTYGNYKFTNASCTGIQPKRTILGDDFVTVLSVTFRMDPWLVSKTGARIDFAQFVDRARVGTGQQSMCYIFDRNKFWVNDNDTWFAFHKDSPHHYSATMHFSDYQGLIGIYLITVTSYEQGETRTVESVTTSSNVTYMGTSTGHAENQYYWANIGSGDVIFNIVTTQDSKDDFDNEDNKAYFEFVWGVITQYQVPQDPITHEYDHSHYHFYVYSNSNSVTMDMNQQGTFDWTTFTLPDQEINAIGISNPAFDGFYKFYYDSTTRRLM